MHQADSTFDEVEVVLDGAVFYFAEVRIPADVDVTVVGDIEDGADVREFRGASAVHL